MSETPESNPGALVVSSPKALTIANRQLRIAGQALARIEQERYLEFFATHPEASRAFVRAVSRYYPCSEEVIARYSEQWDWGRMSKNVAMVWTEGLIERYAHRWDWGVGLSQNEALPWSEALIQRYADHWDWSGHWGGLSKNQALPWSESLIERFKDRWRWGQFGLSWSEALPWSKSLLARYYDRWDWQWLSRNPSLPWTQALIDCYADRWHWSELSGNEALPWSEALFLRYADRWKWECLSRNRALPWTESFLLRYADRWEWGWLSRNEALPWSDDFVHRHAGRWDWWALSLNEVLPWSEALIERYAHGWNWLLLSQNKSLPWNERLIDRYEDRWIWVSSSPDHSDLSGNPALPWSIELIERYEDRWNWGEDGLSTNTSLPWSKSIIERFQTRWNWDLLSWNEAMPWSEALIEMYADRWCWEKIAEIAFAKILPTWSESSICMVMDRVSHGLERGGDSIRGCCVADPIDQAEMAPCLENPAQRAGIDLEMLESGIYLTAYHIEAGVHRVADVAARLAGELEIPVSQLQNYLRCWYNGARDVLEDFGHDVSDMDDPAAVKREFERLFPEAMQGKASTRVPAPVQDKECGSDFIDHAKAEQQRENFAQPSGLNPKMLALGAELAAFHIEAGARRFADFARRFAADLDAPLERLRPYLRACYNGARDMLDDAGYDVSNTDDPVAVKRELERLLAKPGQSDTTAPRPGPAQTEVITPRDVPRSELNQDSPDFADFAATGELDQSSFAWLDTLLDSKPDEFDPVPAFNEEIYAKAKPLFRAFMSDFQAAGADIAEMAKALVRILVEAHGMRSEAIENMRPYLNRFVKDVESGAVTLGTNNEQRNDRDAKALHEEDLRQASEDTRAILDELKSACGVPIFNEATYARLRPHLIAMSVHRNDAACDIADIIRAIIRTLRDQFAMSRGGIMALKPFIIRFAKDVEEGVIDPGGSDVYPNGEG